MSLNGPAALSEEPEQIRRPPSRALSFGASLVVLDPNDPSTTLRAVLQQHDTCEDRLTLLVVFSTAEYEARRRARVEAGVTAPYTIDHLEMDARHIADRAGREWIDPRGFGFEAMGGVGRVQDCIRRATADKAYRHVFVAESPRTVWQRLLRIEGPVAMLTRVLPTSVTTVPVDDVFQPIPNVGGVDAIADLSIDLDLSGKR